MQEHPAFRNVYVCTLFCMKHASLTVGFPICRVFNKTYGGAISSE